MMAKPDPVETVLVARGLYQDREVVSAPDVATPEHTSVGLFIDVAGHTDPKDVVELVLEVSRGGGAPWAFFGSALCPGGDLKQRDGITPAIEAGCTWEVAESVDGGPLTPKPHGVATRFRGRMIVNGKIVTPLKLRTA